MPFIKIRLSIWDRLFITLRLFSLPISLTFKGLSSFRRSLLLRLSIIVLLIKLLFTGLVIFDADKFFLDSILLFSESIIVFFEESFSPLYFISKCFATGRNFFCSIPFTIYDSAINIILTDNSFFR